MQSSVTKAEGALVVLEESVMFLIFLKQMSNNAELLVEKGPNSRKKMLCKIRGF